MTTEALGEANHPGTTNQDVALRLGEDPLIPLADAHTATHLASANPTVHTTVSPPLV